MQATISTPAAQVSYPALPSTEGPTGPTGWGYRLAGLVLFGSLLITGVDAVYSQTMPSVSLVLINFWLGVGLLFKNKHSRWISLVRAALGALIWPIFLFINNDPFTATLMTIINMGTCVPVLLLLTGQSKPWRLVSAMGIFVVCGPGLYGLLMGLVLLAKYLS